MGYLFYRFYKGAKVAGKEKDAELRAYFIFTLIQCINISFIAKVFILIYFQSEVSIPTIYDAIFAGAMFVLNYYLFIRKNKYKSLIEKYKNESNVQRITGIIITWTYVIVSIALSFYSKNNINNIKWTN
jgi:hypothetical protein